MSRQPSPTHTLIDVATEADWRDYHRIRRTVLWEARGRVGYDENHPDDILLSNHPLLLEAERRAVGTVRIDEAENRTGIVRLVAIEPGSQGKGHGRILSRLIEGYAERLGLLRLDVDAAPDAVGCYLKAGWTLNRWSEPERNASLPGSVQLSKWLDRHPVEANRA